MQNASDNMYSVPLDEAWQLFGAFLSGAPDAIALVASTSELPIAACTALDSSLERLDWGPCTFLAWPEELDDAGALFTAVEGLDPCVLVVTDAHMAKLCERAFHRPVAFGAAFRLNCRETLAFEDFPAMLSTPERKQAAWAALKTLPHRAQTR